MTRRYCSGTLSNENDSLDGRQDGGVAGAQAPPSGGAGRVEEAWETVQIPCVHFVNYNSECLDYHNAGFSKGQLISKCLFEKIVWTKIPTKNLIDSALTLDLLAPDPFRIMLSKRGSLWKLLNFGYLY